MKRKTKKYRQSLKRINYDLIVQHRFIVFTVITILLFLILSFKLSNVMINEKEKYIASLDKLTYSTVEGESSPRGRILDRNHNIIVDNIAVKTITYIKKKGTSTKEMIDLAYTVSEHLNLDINKLTKRAMKEFYLVVNYEECKKLITEKEYERYKQKKLSNKDLFELKIERITDENLSKFEEKDKKAAYLYYLMNKGYTYSEKTIKTNVTDQEYAYISENNEKLKGFNSSTSWERTYPYGDTLKSILGKVSTTNQGIPAEEKDYYLSKGYSLNDRVGLSYLEKQYEEYLRGEKSLYEVVSSTETKLIKEGTRGNDIVLSIDINLQQEVERIIEEQMRRAKTEANTEFYDHSSVILQDPNTGEIVVMASKKLINGEVVDNVRSILTSPITPGSVVKGASMLVGYNTGVIRIGEQIVDECIKVAGVAEKCSSHTLGLINDITALSKSSNVYQFKTAIRVNGQRYSRDMKMNFNQSAFDTYRKMYHSFGLGVKTGIDLPVESSGYGAKKDVAAGNLLDYVMGQYETYTPIQLSQYISTIANNGNRLQTHLLKEVRKSTSNNELGEVIKTFEPNTLNKIDTKDEYMARVKEGFYAVVHNYDGYGRGYIEDKLNAAGKTGTSQSFIDTNGDDIIDTETITSSFVGYAPANNPKISIVVTSPNSSHPNSGVDYASLVTLRITKAVMNKYYDMYGV